MTFLDERLDAPPELPRAAQRAAADPARLPRDGASVRAEETIERPEESLRKEIWALGGRMSVVGEFEPPPERPLLGDRAVRNIVAVRLKR